MRTSEFIPTNRITFHFRADVIMLRMFKSNLDVRHFTIVLHHKAIDNVDEMKLKVKHRWRFVLSLLKITL